jgi:hypothetical protein
MVQFSVQFETRKLINRLNAVPEILKEEAENMTEELGEIATQAMREKILSTGTDFSKAAQAVGLNKGPGRIRTGDMYNSIDYRVESGASITRLVFGYLHDPQDYFDIQDGYNNPNDYFKNIWRGIYSRSNGNLLLRKDGTPQLRKRKRGGHKNTKTIQGLRSALLETKLELPRLLKKYRTRVTRRSNKA